MKRSEGYAAGETTPSKKNISTSDLIHFCGNWVWRAVEALVQAKDFNPNPAWVADRLNISVEAAKDALEGLERIGMIEKTESGYKGSAELENFDGADVDRSDRFEIHNKMKDQISAKLTSRDSYANAVLLSSKANMQEFYMKFCNLIEELNNKNMTEGCTSDVYALELSLAKLSRDNK